jgi:hypothetical protein
MEIHFQTPKNKMNAQKILTISFLIVGVLLNSCKKESDTPPTDKEILGNTVSLLPRIDGKLSMQYKLFGLVPISLRELDDVGIWRSSAAGREVLIARSQILDMVFGEKISPPQVPQKWLDRTGAYEIANAGNDVLFFDGARIGQEEGFLIIEYYSSLLSDGSVKLPIAPVSDTEAVILGLGSGMGETIHVVTIDGLEHLQYSGYQLRKISAQ